MEHLSKEDAKWLIEVYVPMKDLMITSERYKTHLKAYNILRNTNKRAGCYSCEAKATASVAQSTFEQHEQTIRDIASPKKGRKKKNV